MACGKRTASVTMHLPTMTANIDNFTSFLVHVIDGEYKNYCERSERLELWDIVRHGLCDPHQVGNRGCLLKAISSGSEFIEKILNTIFPGLPLGAAIKLSLLLQRANESRSIVERSNSAAFQHQLSAATNQLKNSDLKRLWIAWIKGEVKMKEFFAILGSLLKSRRIRVTDYVQASDQILHQTGHLSAVTDPNLPRYDLSLKIPKASVYSIHSITSFVGNDGFETLRFSYRGEDEKWQLFTALRETNISIHSKVFNTDKLRPVTSSQNILWSLLTPEDTGCTSSQQSTGCNMLKIPAQGAEAVVIFIQSLQKTRTSMLEITNILCVDGEIIASTPSTSVQLVIVAEGCYVGRVEDEWQNDLFGDSVDARSEMAKVDVHNNNSPNASGHDDNNNIIIPDYSWRANTFLLNMICTEDYSILTSIVPLTNTLLGDQRVVGIKLQRDWVFMYGMHGLCAVHQTNKCFPRLRKTSRLVPDTTLMGQSAAQNEQRFHSHSSIVTRVDVSNDANVFVSGDNQGKLCVWMTTTGVSKDSTEEAYFPEFRLVQWFNNKRHDHDRRRTKDICEPPLRNSSCVQMLRLSPSTEIIVAAIGTQLQLFHRQLVFQPSTTCTALSIYATLDIQEHCFALYDVSFDHQAALTIWRVSSPLEFSTIPEHNFITLTMWKHFDPSMRNHYPRGADAETSSTDNLERNLVQDQCSPGYLAFDVDADAVEDSKTLEQRRTLRSSLSAPPFSHREEALSSPMVSARTRASTRSGCEISGFASIGGELIPILEAVQLSLHVQPPRDVPSPQPGLSLESDELSSFLAIDERDAQFLHVMTTMFGRNDLLFRRYEDLLAVLAAAFQPPSVYMVSTAMDISRESLLDMLTGPLSVILQYERLSEQLEVIRLAPKYCGLLRWLTSTHPSRLTAPHTYWIDVSIGHNLLCAMYLRFCGNKSIAVEHPWQTYLQTYGPYHLRRASRGLRYLTQHIRKIDETANIKQYLPHQIGYISGLQEIYARRVGLSGTIPREIGELRELRVLSMGNNRLTGPLPENLCQLEHLQRIVLHQNNLVGEVPASLGELGCIVNLAGNPRLEYGPDVPAVERQALVELFHVTKGHRWTNRTHWCTSKPVCKWYKVGVLSSHVHSLVMSSNNMEGVLPPAIGRLVHLRMIELATMPRKDLGL